MFKKIILHITFLTFALYSVSAHSESDRPKHYVILIHGIASTTDVFGEMERALRIDLNKNDSQTNWIPRSFSYETGSSEKSVYDFSLELSHYLDSILLENLKDKETKISLVMHSQGGMIGLRMMLEMYKKNPLYKPYLMKHIDAFISLGTPYWGAKMALFGSRLKPIFDYFKLPYKDKFGSLELRDMEVTSDYLSSIRGELVEENLNNFFYDFNFIARPLVIAGISENLNWLSPFFSGKSNFEDDFLVPLPSSRLDYFYYIEKQKGDDLVGANQFLATEFLRDDQYVIINALHISPLDNSKLFRDMIHVPAKCLNGNYEKCDHPSYRTVVNHLLKREIEKNPKRNLSSFAIDLKLKIENPLINVNDVEVEFVSRTKGLRLGKTPELYHLVKRVSQDGGLRIYRTGDIDSKRSEGNIGIVEVKFWLKGELLRAVHVPVKISQTSYFELID